MAEPSTKEVADILFNLLQTRIIDRFEPIPALLGKGDEDNVVEVEDRANWMYARVHGSDDNISEVLNFATAPVANLAVDVIKVFRPNGGFFYKVLGISALDLYDQDDSQDDDLKRSSWIPRHASQHIIGDANIGGYDPVYIYGRMMYPLRAQQKPTPDMQVQVTAGKAYIGGNWISYAGGNSPTITASPTGYRYTLVYMQSDGTLAIQNGTSSFYSPVQPTPPSNVLPICYVLTSISTTAITEGLIYDARLLYMPTISGDGEDADAIHDNVSGEIAAITSKTTPVDDDVTIIEDSAASNAKKSLSWVNIKATLKTYFDTLYAGITHATRHQSGGADPIKLDDLAAPDDNTDLNATTSAHGLLPKLDNVATNFLNGQGAWSVPAGGSASDFIDLGDVPAAYTGAAGKVVAVKSGEDGLEFVDAAGGSVDPSFTVPVNANFTWVNQGGASITDVADTLFLRAPADSGTNVRLRKKSAPSTPWTLTVAIRPALAPKQFSACGVVFRQSSDGKLATFQVTVVDGTGVVIGASYLDSATSYNSEIFTAGIFGYLGPFIWLRIADNGTNRICSASSDGRHFTVLSTVGRTTFLTADEIGFFANCNNSSFADVGITLYSWLEE